MQCSKYLFQKVTVSETVKRAMRRCHFLFQAISHEGGITSGEWYLRKAALIELIFK